MTDTATTTRARRPKRVDDIRARLTDQEREEADAMKLARGMDDSELVRFALRALYFAMGSPTTMTTALTSREK